MRIRVKHFVRFRMVLAEYGHEYTLDELIKEEWAHKFLKRWSKKVKVLFPVVEEAIINSRPDYANFRQEFEHVMGGDLTDECFAFLMAMCRIFLPD